MRTLPVCVAAVAAALMVACGGGVVGGGSESPIVTPPVEPHRGVPIASCTHYVSPAGSASWANAVNLSTPTSVQIAFDSATAGNVVCFRGGTYQVPAKNFLDPMHGYYEPQNAGAIDQYIVFAAYPGEMPVFNGTTGGSGDRDGQGYFNFATIFGTNNKSYIVFDGFTFQAENGTRMARVVIGTGYPDNTGQGHVVIQNCEFNGGTHVISDSTDNNEGLRIEAAVDVLIKNNALYNYRHVTNWHNTSAIKTYHDDNVVIENCELYNNSLAVFFKSSTEASIVSYSYIHDNNQGILITPEIAPNMNMDNLKIYHNVIVGNYESGLSHTGPGADALTHGNDFLVFNNTFYNNGRGSVQTGNAIVGYNESGHGTSFFNNISLSPQRLSFGTWDRSNWRNYLKTADHNQWGASFLVSTGINVRNTTYATLSSWMASEELENPINVGCGLNKHPGCGDLASDPLFVNGSGLMNQLNDFALSPSSPCKGSGRFNEGLGRNDDIGADASLAGIR